MIEPSTPESANTGWYGIDEIGAVLRADPEWQVDDGCDACWDEALRQTAGLGRGGVTNAYCVLVDSGWHVAGHVCSTPVVQDLLDALWDAPEVTP